MDVGTFVLVATGMAVSPGGVAVKSGGKTRGRTNTMIGTSTVAMAPIMA